MNVCVHKYKIKHLLCVNRSALRFFSFRFSLLVIHYFVNRFDKNNEWKENPKSISFAWLCCARLHCVCVCAHGTPYAIGGARRTESETKAGRAGKDKHNKYEKFTTQYTCIRLGYHSCTLCVDMPYFFVILWSPITVCVYVRIPYLCTDLIPESSQVFVFVWLFAIESGFCLFHFCFIIMCISIFLCAMNGRNIHAHCKIDMKSTNTNIRWM